MTRSTFRFLVGSIVFALTLYATLLVIGFLSGWF